MTLFIFRDKDRLDKWLRFYVHHKALYSKGWREVGFLYSLFSPQSMMIGWLFLKSFFPTTPYWMLFIILPLGFIAEVGIGWTIGNWWDKNKIFQKEADWDIKRNPALKGVTDELLKNVKIQGH